jgi:predicted permease
VVQVALSLVLVAGALLFSRSLNKLETVDTGFRQDGILITQAGFAQLNMAPERRLSFKRQMLDGIRSIPGVDAAAETNIVPLSGNGWGNAVWLDGTETQRKLDVSFSQISPNYFQALNVPLLAGRDFNDHDAANAPKVAIVNETLARKLLDGVSPIGQRFRKEATPTTPETVYEIVGLMKDTKYEDLRENFGPIAYLANSQEPGTTSTGGQFVIHSNLPPAELTAAVKNVLAEINPAISIRFINFKLMIGESMVRDRLMATLSGFFGLLALLLASIGLYGILSYGVASRTKEIGIRMALGARSREVLSLILREALLLVLVGVVVGLPVVFASTRFASALLFNLTPTDPLSLAGAALLLLAVALVAGYIPARRATKVDPLVALRYE